MMVDVLKGWAEPEVAGSFTLIKPIEFVLALIYQLLLLSHSMPLFKGNPLIRCGRNVTIVS